MGTSFPSWQVLFLYLGGKANTSEAKSHRQPPHSTILLDINGIFVIDMPNPITYPVKYILSNLKIWFLLCL